MSSLRYPIGIQNFPELIEGGYTYIDKTQYIIELLNGSKYYFLSRPRRFGKSLLLSTLHAYFEGRRDLFKGLAIEKADIEWTPSPVLHFDFNAGLYDRENGLEERLSVTLSQYEMRYNIFDADSKLNPSSRFENLIRSIYDQTGKQVVILVDEYDKPLLGIEDNKELFEKNQATLKGFFGNLKSMDACIRFAFLTGVARFNKVSIFSDLNNLNDISLTNQYADICGWTEEELKNTFHDGIKELAGKLGKDYDSTVKALRDYYDGYLFSKEGHRLYNPFSVLLALTNKDIEPYWFETGTPTFLVNRVKSSKVELSTLNHQYCNVEEMKAIGLENVNPIALMFQTGYLTVESYDKERRRYLLRFPNREVELGFAKSLYPYYIANSQQPNSPFNIFKFQDDLYDGDPESFMKRLRTLVKDMPYEDNVESSYRNIVWLLCTLSGTHSSFERHSYRGRTDVEIYTTDYIYIFEFKYNGSVDSAMKQISDRDYAGRFSLDPRTIYLIGANFSDKGPHRGLTGWEICDRNGNILSSVGSIE